MIGKATVGLCWKRDVDMSIQWLPFVYIGYHIDTYLVMVTIDLFPLNGNHYAPNTSMVALRLPCYQMVTIFIVSNGNHLNI